MKKRCAALIVILALLLAGSSLCESTFVFGDDPVAEYGQEVIVFGDDPFTAAGEPTSPPIIVPATLSELSHMSFDELVAFHQATYKEILRRAEFKEVKIPAGEYVVGTDIPVGEYSVSTNEYLVSIVINEYADVQSVREGESIGRLVLKNGDRISFSGSVTLSPYVGLGF